MFDLAVHGMVLSEALREGWLYVRDGRIVSFTSEKKNGPATTTIQLGPDDILLPAATDLHAHLRDWRQASKETVFSGTMGALAGGVTTVAEMPNTEPRIDSVEMVSKRIELLNRESLVDFAIHAGVPLDSSIELKKLRKAGAFALKLYPQDLGRFGEIARLHHGMKLVVHAEDPSLIGTKNEGEAEPRAVAELLGQIDERTTLRFAHISTSSAVGMILSSTMSGHLTMEVAPHHLFMSKERAESKIGRTSVVRPPLRSLSNARKMVTLLREGSLDFYATDHAPHTIAEKKNSANPAPGFPALEFAFPLLLTKTRDLSLSCRVFCENPALYLGMKKGRIAPGYLADLVVMRKESSTVDPDRFVSKGRITPFRNERLAYSVATVIKDGEVVYDNGRMERRPTVRLVA